MKKIGVIILAAGQGTRMKSEKPKVCFDLAGKTLIERVVNTSYKLEADPVAVVVGYKKDLVKASIPPNEKLHFLTQERQLGTGDAVKSAKELFKDFKGTVFVLCGDVPLLKKETLFKMLETHEKLNSKCTVLSMVLNEPDKYGRIVRDSVKRINSIVEYKDASEEIRKIKEVNTGIYCFDANILFKALEKVTNDNQQKEYYLTDVIKILYSENQRIETVILEDPLEASGINSITQLAELERSHYQAIREYWMENGVYIENPDTVLIEEDVIIESDVYISANTKVMGKSIIGANSFIGNNSIIIDAHIDANSFFEGMNVVKDIKNEALKLKFLEKKGV